METDYLSPEEMQGWLRQEIADSAKAMELRVRQAAELATSYASGKITPQEAAKRHAEYDQRWGEALPGTNASKNRTDEEILAAIDDARKLGGFAKTHLNRQSKTDKRVQSP